MLQTCMNGALRCTLPPPDMPSSSCIHTKRSFHLVKTEDIDRGRKSSSLVTVPGTRKIHSIKSLGRNILATRRLSCFCTSCIEDNPEMCENGKFVDKWDIIKLKLQDSDDDDTHSPHVRSLIQHDRRPSQKDFFQQLSQDMEGCTTYKQLEVAVTNQQNMILSFPLPSEYPRTAVDVHGTVDKEALSLQPGNAPPNLYPLKTEAEGNCLPRAVSTLVYGHQENFKELWCRIVAEHINNKETYLAGTGMAHTIDDCLHVAAMQVVVADGSGRHSAEEVSHSDIKNAFEKEVLAIAKDKEHMGLWQLMAVAHIVSRPVVSVYPELGWDIIQALNTRTLRPALCQNDQPLYLMWSSNRTDSISENNWTSNHFVPMMPIVDPASSVSVEDVLHEAFLEGPVSVNDFFTIDWKGQEFVAQVLELDGNMIKVSFLHKKQGIGYYYPPTDDLSWEDIGNLKRKISLEMDLTRSTHRCQFFRCTS